jgi:hypothetical protein
VSLVTAFSPCNAISCCIALRNSCQMCLSHGTCINTFIRPYPGFNFFDADDDALFRSILRGEFNISGLQNKSLRRFLPHLNSGQVSRLLKRLRLHGLIKKVGHTYKYYVTQFGKDVLSAGLKLRELVIIPQLAYGRVA